MIDFTKSVQLTDGTAVRIICTDARGIYPIVGLIENFSLSMTRRFMKNGSAEGDEYSLMNVPKERRLTGWINVNEDNIDPVVVLFDKRGDADFFAEKSRVACIDLSKIKYTVGEGLDD